MPHSRVPLPFRLPCSGVLVVAGAVIAAVALVYGGLVGVAKATGTTLVGGARRVAELSMWTVTTLQVRPA